MSVVAAQTQTSSSRSPSRRSLGDKISALGARLSRTLSHADESHEEDQYSIDSPPSYYKNERSTSRGRDAFSTGRGGLGNIRQASLSRDARPDSGPDDFSTTRGREPHPARTPSAVFSTGRGGAGNLRSPSRGPAPAAPGADVAEQEVIREYTAAHEGAPVSSGRGGIGNITHSRSRSRPPPAVHSTGRGGAGNIHPGDGHRPELLDAEERRHVSPHEGPHSTGRGGQANISNLHEPPVEHHEHPHPHFESTGRGGAGNIVSERARSKSKSRE